MLKVKLDEKKVKLVKSMAADIAEDIHRYVKGHTTVSVERAVLRLYGVDGIDQEGTPLCNRIIDLFKEKKMLGVGISPLFARCMALTKKDVQTTAETIIASNFDLENLTTVSAKEADKIEQQLATDAVKKLDQSRKEKAEKKKKWKDPDTPWRYLIVATGNIYEDRTQAQAAVSAGADIIAVIRSTAQSLLDYVPYGATTEGYGGTYATQENFKIMREALDEISASEQRYIKLVNYSSGLCMAEIAACAALEDLDMLLNDSMYGILFRDINMKRTFIDQYFSRLICARAGIYINTGEDNYLTTSDAIENAHTVTSSQLINEALADDALIPPALMGLGHAYEINPKVENALTLELAHALLARALFPEHPLKYMPPTKFKSTDIFKSHAMDTMFNFSSILTGQGIHLAGILTEAIHTPFMQDRYQAIDSINYVFNIAKDLGNELELSRDSAIQKRAEEVLDETVEFLETVEKIGLMKAIDEGMFADIKRPVDGGKGFDGVVAKEDHYSNPIMKTIVQEGIINE